jgi:hypothetical protein
MDKNNGYIEGKRNEVTYIMTQNGRRLGNRRGGENKENTESNGNVERARK